VVERYAEEQVEQMVGLQQKNNEVNSELNFSLNLQSLTVSW